MMIYAKRLVTILTFAFWAVLTVAPRMAWGGICTEPVDTNEGPVVGMADKDVNACVYKGIPFAAPPSGQLRWKAPQPAVERSSIHQAHEFGSDCSQSSLIPVGNRPAGSEDCLYLNVWRPRKEGVFPVMVWIHGGGFSRGSSSTPMYWGDRLAAQKDVVVVTFNYRLGAFGFMAHPELSELDERGSSGNYGFLDQVAALQWIKDNIAGFGSDPDNVTIFGESAGGRSVCFHLASPLSAGLFHKAIMESGSCDTINTMEDGYENTRKLAEHVGCPGADQLECLRSRSSQELADNNPAPGDPLERGVGFGEFELRGTKVTALAQPWRFHLLAKVQKAFNELEDTPKEEVRALMRDLGLESLLFLPIDRQVKRHDHLEVWG